MYNQIFSELHSNQYLTEIENLEVSNYKRVIFEKSFVEIATIKINNQLFRVSRNVETLQGENKFRVLSGSFGILK